MVDDSRNENKTKLKFGKIRKMTIDFKNHRIYHFNKDINLTEHLPISTDFKEIEVLSNGDILVIENYYKYENEGKSNLYCLNQQLKIEWFLPYPYENATSMDIHTWKDRRLDT